MTNKEQLFGVLVILAAISWGVFAFYLDGFYYTKDAPKHLWLFVIAYWCLIVAGLLQLTIIIEDRANVRTDQ